MNTVITPYSIELSDGSTKTGYTITYKDNFDNEISVEEYYGSTAEEWLNLNGYTAIRLVALMDIENKLNSLNLSSEKLSSTRNWINQLMASYAAHQGVQLNWPIPPHKFEDVMLEALGQLQ